MHRWSLAARLISAYRDTDRKRGKTTMQNSHRIIVDHRVQSDVSADFY